MSGQTLRRTVTITNPHGLHLRPATVFVRWAALFQSSVAVFKGDKRIDGKSPFELLMLAAEQGTALTLEVSGPDAPAALEALVNVLTAASSEELPEPPPAPPRGGDAPRGAGL